MRVRIPVRTRRLAALVALAAAPKCTLCLLAYAGAAVVTFDQAEVCGESASGFHAMLPWLALACAGITLGGAAFLHRCPKTVPKLVVAEAAGGASR